ncbi:5-carboxymethyl-2-hydroxymuconate Delta-isomerase [Qingshengfaniella alkalisoli]|uniref:5-carboxymethyl-2-hydroxymuconate isomerase n=1 Tax=Qingshengfaniella alkalisoli TaxID=2599296 RepID=A0A5B8J2H8_9RHOB|nr:5-carboxymethyl-2-hydroxymuconate isomerase [Qingshengfaniella alkalisoli]QDY70978.1 5-carboxymethyl-2-hydroxymuconate isomerase [Qingshengfaniella alkalisoli]
MPHVRVEFSKGLEDSHDMQALCERLFDALAGQDDFDAPAIKVRATAAEFFHIGTEPQTFAHATLMLMGGRDEDTRKRLNQVILDVLAEQLPDVGSLTVQDLEMTRTTYARRLL